MASASTIPHGQGGLCSGGFRCAFPTTLGNETEGGQANGGAAVPGFTPRSRRVWCSLAPVADRSGMTMQAQDRRDASETLFTRVRSGHIHLQTACAMLEGDDSLSHLVSPGGLALLATTLHVSIHISYCEMIYLVLRNTLANVGVRAKITDVGSPKDEL